MKYSKELHDDLKGFHGYAGEEVIKILLDEIDRLQNQATDYVAVNAKLVENAECLTAELAELRERISMARTAFFEDGSDRDAANRMLEALGEPPETTDDTD